MSEVKVEIRGNASQFGQVAREVKRELEEIKRAAGAGLGGSDPILGGVNAAREQAARSAKMAREVSQSMISAATDHAQGKIRELNNAAGDAVADSAARSAKETAKAIGTVRTAAEGLGTSLFSRLWPLWTVALSGFAILDSYTRKRAERMDIARDLGSTSGQVAVVQNQLGAVGITTASLAAAGKNIRQARSDAMAGEDQTIDAFKALGFDPSAPSFAKGNGVDLLMRALQVVGRRGGDRESRLALRKLLGADESRIFEGWAAGGAFNSDEVMRMSGRGDFEAGIENVFNEARFRGKYFRNMDPISTFDVDKKETAERLQLANQQTALHLQRQGLSIEKQVTEATAERARLMKLINNEADPVKKQRYIADSLQLEAELMALKKEADKPVGLQASPGGRSDPLRSMGADLSMWGMSRMRDAQVEMNRRLAQIERNTHQSVAATREVARTLN